MKKYDVTLSNKDCIFDSAEGFEGIADVLKWASGRGGTYVVQLGDGSETTFSRYYPGGWVRVTVAEIEDML